MEAQAWYKAGVTINRQYRLNWLSSLLLLLILPTTILLCAGCSSGAGQYVAYEVPVVREMAVIDEPVYPGYTALIRYRIAMETVYIPAGLDFPAVVQPLVMTVSDGEVVPLHPSVYDGNGDLPSFEDAQQAWNNFGDTGYGLNYPAYQAPYIYFLYRAPAHEQNVRTELNLGNGGGPGNRGHSGFFLVQWPYD